MNVFLKPIGTPVCLIQVKIVISMFYHVNPIVLEVHDNSKL